jgi:hypothetical protein
MAIVQQCGSCSGSVQHSSNINNTYDVPWRVFVTNDNLCVRFVNSSSTNVTMNTWVEDSAGNGVLSDPSYAVQVAPGGEMAVCYSAFGFQADQSTPISDCILHTVLTNDDNANEGVEIYHEVF